MPDHVYVILGTDGRAIEILKNAKHAAQLSCTTAYMLRKDATSQIREQVWVRDGRACTHCGAPVTRTSMELHERIWRGRGGEISVANSTTLCNNCHHNDPVAGHGKRKVQWTRG